MTFFAGAFVGAGVMLFVMSLCAVAADADRQEKRMIRQDGRKNDADLLCDDDRS